MNDEILYGLYSSSLFYVVVYILTFVAHFAGVSYVVGGVIYLAWRQLISRQVSNLDTGISLLIRDWMPFALSAAITLGVAPLLFVQVIYPKHFYTGNLLMGWRWMLIIPALIVGFYLLYLIKSKFFEKASRGPRMVILATTSLCFLFVGAGWSSNHALMEIETSWPHIYFDISTIDTVLPSMLIRMAIWLGGMLLTFPMLIAWQIRWTGDVLGEEMGRTVKGLLWTVRSGVVLAAIGLGVMNLPIVLKEWPHMNEWLFRRVLETSIVTGLLYWVYWESVRVLPAPASRLSLLSFVWLVGALTGGVAREINRIILIDLKYNQKWMDDAAGSGGFWTFLIFVAINVFLVRYCILLVVRRLKEPVQR
ncbi:MAG: hypothetical protein KDA68_01190 [Planctomycetaceae bacterium]|nr:hypothetical protein [Planctomycetaceae bacterium]